MTGGRGVVRSCGYLFCLAGLLHGFWFVSTGGRGGGSGRRPESGTGDVTAGVCRGRVAGMKWLGLGCMEFLVE